MEDREPESVKLEISIPFEMASCASCGTAGAGKCSECGQEIDPPSLDSYASARQRALQAAAERAGRLLTEMRTVASGDVPLAPDQFLAAVEELEIWTMLDDLDSVGKSFNGLDLGTRKLSGPRFGTPWIDTSTRWSRS